MEDWMEFTDVVGSEDELRALMGDPDEEQRLY